ncbi:MAG: ABC transporter permease, partial [Enterobacteriaceae bacterium]
MYQPVAFYIGLRYMRGRAADRFSRFVSWLSTIGITLGVMALITVLSVMNGFEQEMEKSILSLIPQAIVTTAQGQLDPQKQPKTALQTLQGVTGVTPLTQGDVVLQSAKGLEVAIMLGVDPASAEPLFHFMVADVRPLLPAGQYQVILGARLADKLGVAVGDRVRLLATSVSQFTPMGRVPSQRLFTVAGTFSANSEVDDYQLLVNIDDASRLMRYPIGHIGGWRLFLQQPLAVAEVTQQALPSGL